MLIFLLSNNFLQYVIVGIIQWRAWYWNLANYHGKLCTACAEILRQSSSSQKEEVLNPQHKRWIRPNMYLNFIVFFLVTRGYFQPHGEGEAWSPDKAADKDSSVAKQFWPGMSPGKGSYFGIFRKFQGNLYKFGRTAQNCVCRQSGLNLCVCSCFCLQSIYFCPPCSWFTLCSKARKARISLTISTGLPVMVITNLADL